MRYSPSGQYIAYEHRAEPRRIDIARADTGVVVASYLAGQNPRWVDDTHLVAESPDGLERWDSDFAFSVHYVPANRGQLDANGAGVWAVSEPIGTTTFTLANGDSDIVEEAREPRVSGRGTLVVRSPETGVVRLYSGTELGLAEDARWSSETIVWWLAGRVWGRSTPDVATVELTVPGRACYHACPLWDGTTLWVGLVIDEGELWLATWSDLVAQNGRGWRVGVSGGSNFSWDMVRA